MLYPLHESPKYEQTMEMMLTMIEYGGAKEDDDDFQSALDLLFEALEEEQPANRHKTSDRATSRVRMRALVFIWKPP